MHFEIEINGRIRHVTVEQAGASGPAGSQFHVTVDGAAHDVTAAPTNLGVSVLYRASGRSVDAAVTDQSRGHCFVQLPHVNLTAVVDGRRYERGVSDTATRAGEQRVLAPMPGRVVRILVQPGDEVATRQGLVIVEAMKMENELGSPKAGRVKEIAVTEGVSVEAGRLLVVVE
jgi:biotin carboxyl carrier protein